MTSRQRTRVATAILIAVFALVATSKILADDAPLSDVAASNVTLGRGTHVQMAAEQFEHAYKLESENTHARQLAIESSAIGDPALFSAPMATTVTPSVSRPVTGSVVLQEGACCVGGTAGSPVSIRAAFKATSSLARVTEMRAATRYGGGCLKESEMASISWEPFVASKEFTVTAAINWS